LAKVCYVVLKDDAIKIARNKFVFTRVVAIKKS